MLRNPPVASSFPPGSTAFMSKFRKFMWCFLRWIPVTEELQREDFPLDRVCWSSSILVLLVVSTLVNRICSFCSFAAVDYLIQKFDEGCWERMTVLEWNLPFAPFLHNKHLGHFLSSSLRLLPSVVEILGIWNAWFGSVCGLVGDCIYI